MGYYALLVPPFTGHLNPMIVLGRALQARGHRIAFLSPPDSEARVRHAGFEFIAIAAHEFPLGEWERMNAHNAELTGLKASRYICSGLARFARGILRDLPQIAARERFDGLVMDQVSVGTESVCQAIGLPMALACCALIFHTESGVPPLMFHWSGRKSLPLRLRNFFGQLVVYSSGLRMLRHVAPYRLKHRLPPMGFNHINETPPSLVQVSQQPAFFDFTRDRLPNHFHYTGPWLDPEPRDELDFPWDRLDGRPLIYASMGTLQNRLTNVFRIIAEACAGLEAQLVIALGCRTAETPRNLAGQPIVVGFAPQRSLIRRSSVVITHGGMNTTLETLYEGLPMIALPVANDQPGIAARIKHLGLGEFIPVKKLTIPRLQGLLHRVQTIPSYRERALKYATEMRPLNGPTRAATLIEQAFTSRQRIRRESPNSLIQRQTEAGKQA